MCQSHSAVECVCACALVKVYGRIEDGWQTGEVGVGAAHHVVVVDGVWLYHKVAHQHFVAEVLFSAADEEVAIVCHCVEFALKRWHIGVEVHVAHFIASVVACL